ncbi:hypothetical protein OL229_09605 [Neisseriaceae bacterium JH1-16]|nr:hypothetical protein [Neisseriaceae bacterium JH1-16]
MTRPDTAAAPTGKSGPAAVQASAPLLPAAPVVPVVVGARCEVQAG